MFYTEIPPTPLIFLKYYGLLDSEKISGLIFLVQKGILDISI